MDYEFVSATIVVVVDGFNPAIMRPDRLSRLEIVPKDWTPVQVQDAGSDPFPKVVYENRYQLVFAPPKLLVHQSYPSTAFNESHVPEIANRLLHAQGETLMEPKAVGVNLDLFIPMSNGDRWMVDHFLTVSGPAPRPQSATVALVYERKSTMLNLTVGAIERETDNEKDVGILLAANYHIDLGSSASLSDAKRAISRFPELAEDFMSFWPTVVGGDDREA